MAWMKLMMVAALVAFTDVLGSPATKNSRGPKSGNGGGGGGGGGGPKTCPGFPGYCSESYPGDTCLVVCAFGRNNVPECQPDGTWTDIPRCIEHEPGVPDQLPGLCPGIPGYCSIDYPGGVCEFDCLSGPDIRSFCTPDGTWDPYPTCDGDIRETRDGCDPCPGPFGGPRNRTTEASSGAAPARKPAQPKPAAQPNQAAAPPRQNNNNRGQGNGNGNGSNNRQQQQPPAPQRQQQPQQQAAFAQNNNRPQQQQQQQNNRQQPPPQQQQQQQQQQANPWANKNNGNGFQQQPQQQQQQPPKQHQQQQSNQLVQGGGGGGGAGGCPGGSLEACIDVCPSDSARIFGACVGGCARRCPSKK